MEVVPGDDAYWGSKQEKIEACDTVTSPLLAQDDVVLCIEATLCYRNERNRRSECEIMVHENYHGRLMLSSKEMTSNVT
jgi:hypothetical protein